jgi:hypothetical protein
MPDYDQYKRFYLRAIWSIGNTTVQSGKDLQGSTKGRAASRAPALPYREGVRSVFGFLFF